MIQFIGEIPTFKIPKKIPKKNKMTQKEKIKYIDIGLRLLNIELNKELLKKVIKVIEVVDKKKGNSNVKDFIKIKNEKQI